MYLGLNFKKVLAIIHCVSVYSVNFYISSVMDLGYREYAFDSENSVSITASRLSLEK